MYSGNDNDSCTSEVGLLLSPMAAKALTGYQCVSERLLTARFDCGNNNMTVVVRYAPTDVSEDRVKENFYLLFNDVLKSHKLDIRVVVGDFNSRVGNNSEGHESVLISPCNCEISKRKWPQTA